MSPNIKNESLYVHIPFCGTLCHYCDFTKMFYAPDRADRYLDRLFLELDGYAPQNLKTIYVGGGTPTSLSHRQLGRLLAKLQPLLGLEYEFTVEGNIENATPEKLALLRAYGVNRLSLGVQSFDDAVLHALNRHHRASAIVNVVREAKLAGFTNINVDLIYDLPGQSNDVLERDIAALISLDVPHIATYSLSVHPGTVFGLQGVKEADDEVSRHHYDMILERLRAAGYARYEVSNFARPGSEGHHNLNYWDNGLYFGIGLGASGYLCGKRYTNTKNLTKYLSGADIQETEAIGLSDEETYYLILKLRQAKGFSSDEFAALFPARFETRYARAIAKLTRSGLLQSSKDRWYATDEGMILLDRVLVTLLEEIE